MALVRVFKSILFLQMVFCRGGPNGNLTGYFWAEALRHAKREANDSLGVMFASLAHIRPRYIGWKCVVPAPQSFLPPEYGVR